MKVLKHTLALTIVALFSGFFHPLIAQNLEPDALTHPSRESWPTYHGDYSGRRHSNITQITPQNVSYLSLAWAFQTNQNAAIKSTPLLVDGILYFTVPDNIWAVDAR
jgi:alcohol dehydrogenase (cytochrome c)